MSCVCNHPHHAHHCLLTTVTAGDFAAAKALQVLLQADTSGGSSASTNTTQIRTALQLVQQVEASLHKLEARRFVGPPRKVSVGVDASGNKAAAAAARSATDGCTCRFLATFRLRLPHQLNFRHCLALVR